MLNLEEVIQDTRWHLGAIHELISERVFPPPGEDTDKAKKKQDNPPGQGEGEEEDGEPRERRQGDEKRKRDDGNDEKHPQE
jgi:hypothetical protein